MWTAETCKASGGAKKPIALVMILDTSVNPPDCVPMYDDSKCQKIEIDTKSPVKLIAKKDASGCEPVISKKTKDECDKLGQDLAPDELTCVEKKKLTKDECDKLGKALAPDELSCIERKKEEDKKEEESEAEKECRVNNEKRGEDKGGIVTDWKIKDGKCIDTKADKSGKKKTEEKEEPEVKVRPEQPFTAPPRFVPIQIPTRQMYVLPGMP